MIASYCYWNNYLDNTNICLLIFLDFKYLNFLDLNFNNLYITTHYVIADIS
jgi:hypothetical protein